MAESDRPDADADIEFDFFEDLPTTERPAEKAPPPKRSGRPPIRRKPPGSGASRTPLLRLALLIVGAIVLAVVLILWITSCRGSGDSGSYQDYMNQVDGVVKQSDSIGQQLESILTGRGSSLDEVQTKLEGLAKQQAQVVTRTQALQPPSPLVEEQQSLVETMELRESGLAGLARAFGQIQLATPADQAGATLAEQAARLVAAEVVYDDLFRARSQEVMKQQGISGVAVPESNFLPSPDLVSQSSLTEFVKRLQGGGSTSGLHGNSIVAVRVQPSGQTLSQTNENTIAASDKLQFQVSVKNSGDYQETQVEVTLTIQFSQGPIKKTETIPVINQGQTANVFFKDFANITFGEPTTLKVSVKPVPGEQNTSNNAAEYPVIFSLQ